MADENNLDDFFAKKDKSKKKSSKSRITPDDIGQMLEKKLAKSSKKSASVPKKKDKEGTNNAEPFNVKVEEDDGEWKEYEEETEKDYSGLRIQNLQITSKDEDNKEMQDNGHSGDDEDGERKDVPQGPWRAFSSTNATTTETVAASEPVSNEPKEEVPKSTGKYIPPAARRAQATGAAPMGGGGGGASNARRKKTAPNVNSQEDFPTLGFANSDAGDVTGQEFERVRSGGRQIEDPSNKSVKLSLGNKYGALEGKDS